MANLKTYLKKSLERARSIAVLGIGSDLRGDDAAGTIVIKKLKGAPVGLFSGSTAPENLTGEIRRFKPSHVILIDTVDAGARPGTIIALRPSDIGDAVSFSTHNMPARVLIEYLERSMKCDVIFIGIQPGSIDFGRRPSASVRKAADEVADAIRHAAGKVRTKGLTN